MAPQQVNGGASEASSSQGTQLIRIGRQDPSLGRTRQREPRTVLLLHGPSSNLFGERDPVHYGTTTLEEIELYATKAGASFGLKVVCAQDNYEGAMIEHIHAARSYGAIVMNPNSFVHYSYAIRDAIQSVQTPVIEIHLSNLYARASTEPYRAQNVTAAAAKGYIGGCGLNGYRLAMCHAATLIDEAEDKLKSQS